MTSLPDSLSDDQRRVIKAMEEWLIGDKHLFVLTADRGRGKSTLLGSFANRLLGSIPFRVTSASRAQASVLLDVLADQERQVFIAPDELVRQQRRLPCLMIDEAAMLPNNLLQRCLALADKVLLATTTGGYEGTGKGFQHKFMQRLQQQEHVHFQLHEPLRWGSNDQLESLFNDMLMLDLEDQAPSLARTDVQIWQVSKGKLFEDHALLRQVYGLLVSAHYRTRPSDLRQLMEDDNQILYVAGSGDQVVAVMLLNREGGFDENLCHDVFMGKRRPQGHLLAQMLTAQAGVRNFACYRGLRIQRITVHGSYRKQGIGRMLSQQALQHVVEEKLDYLGSSFALDSTMSLFWKNTGFMLMHVSAGKGKSTGRQAVAVLQSSQPEISKAMRGMHERVVQNFPVWLLTYCNDMLWQDVQGLLDLLQARYSFSEIEEDELQAFVGGYRGLDLSLAALQKLLVMCLPHVSSLQPRRTQLLIEKILLNRSRDELVRTLGFSGRKDITNELRQGAGICYDYYRSIQPQ